jgi:hypothetical protein
LAIPQSEFSALEIFKELISEKKGEAAKSKEIEERRKKMKNFIT